MCTNLRCGSYAEGIVLAETFVGQLAPTLHEVSRAALAATSLLLRLMRYWRHIETSCCCYLPIYSSCSLHTPMWWCEEKATCTGTAAVSCAVHVYLMLGCCEHSACIFDAVSAVHTYTLLGCCEHSACIFDAGVM